jgi:hypothetical protein
MNESQIFKDHQILKKTKITNEPQISKEFENSNET